MLSLSEVFRIVERDRPSVSSPSEEVYRQLAVDYPPDALEWIREVDWEGPVDVPLDEIDFSNKKSWRAWKEMGKVKRFAKRIDGGWKKPIVLIDRPGKRTLMIADGHHRALSYMKLQQPARAYVAHVPSLDGPWDWLHDSQREKEEWR